jgi:small GTP-binding protein
MKIQLWDSAGQERFRGITEKYYHSATVIIMVYDITTRESFEHLRAWLANIRSNCPGGGPLIALVGTKCDLPGPRTVPRDDAERYHEEINSIFFEEVSAKSGVGVQEVFIRTATAVATVRHIKFRD